jgi:hypothetical protein
MVIWDVECSNRYAYNRRVSKDLQVPLRVFNLSTGEKREILDEVLRVIGEVLEFFLEKIEDDEALKEFYFDGDLA